MLWLENSVTEADCSFVELNENHSGKDS